MSFHRLETLILFYVFQFLLSGNLLPFLYLQLPFLSPLRYLLTFNEVKVFLPLICILLLYVEHRDIAFKRKTKSNSLFKRYWVGARGSPPYRLTPPWLLLVQHVRSTFISITSEPAKRRLFPYFVSNEAIWSPQHFLIRTNSKIVCIWHLEIKIKTIKCVIFLSYVNTNLFSMLGLSLSLSHPNLLNADFLYFVSNEAIGSPQHFLIRTNSKIVCIWHLKIKI